MKTKDLRNALKERLASAYLTPVAVWPGVDHSGAKPYLQISFTGVERQGDGITGNEILAETGQMNVVVVVDAGTGENLATDYADEVAERFPEGLSLDFEGGQLAVIVPPQIRGGFPTDADYRVPVAIQYHALRS